MSFSPSVGTRNALDRAREQSREYEALAREAETVIASEKYQTDLDLLLSKIVQFDGDNPYKAVHLLGYLKEIAERISGPRAVLAMFEASKKTIRELTQRLESEQD